jgi:hypothetical protein
MESSGGLITGPIVSAPDAIFAKATRSYFQSDLDWRERSHRQRVQDIYRAESLSPAIFGCAYLVVILAGGISGTNCTIRSTMTVGDGGWRTSERIRSAQRSVAHDVNILITSPLNHKEFEVRRLLNI